ncbi:PQQ-binding-like beta-propeller repeat protein [Plantactinospora siamensis]|uniref:PQQ-binding-like beta-propeller repeat protein n=1 Tax=Plantactinospora siamensis TaxID=555372 RepID=A0ABV6NSD4_9ACTN
MATIELGELTPDRPELLPGAPGGWPRWPAVLAVLALMAALAGSGPDPRGLPGTDVAAPVGALVVLGGDRLFVADPSVEDPSRPRTSRLTVYRLPDGRKLTEQPLALPPLGPPDLVGRVGDMLLFTSWQSDPQQVFALDAATGALRWRQPARPAGITTAGHVLLAPPGPAEQPAPSRLWSVDAVTGAQQWSVDLPGGTMASGRSDPLTERVSLLVHWLPTGRLVLLDPDSGRQVGARDVPPPTPDGELSVAAGLVLVGTPDGVTTAYGLDGLDRRWRRTGLVGRQSEWTDCAGLLCLADQQLEALDPATGLTRWRQRPSRLAFHNGNALLVVDQDGRDPTGTFPVAVLDRDTGHVRAELGRWALVGTSGDGRRVYGVRYGHDGVSLVAVLDPIGATVRVLGALRDLVGSCQARWDLLICLRTDSRLGIWRLTG